MSYVKLTDFAVKDSLLSGNPNKLVKGTELNAEFDAIATADALNLTAAAAAAAYLPIGGTAVSATKATNIAGGAVGQIPYQSAVDTTAMLAAGTSGQYLKSNGGAAPSWASISQVQIQPISAVANTPANGLTISASALSLDFRSSTLTSGTVTTVSGTPANLVISSGSTLGTISAQASRLVVLALNNAGTIELAVSNIAGGVNLDETGVISTTAEGGAGAADSANVIYSTTARTNVAYRVIGYVESTQATAGTWATAPSTIQGQGGQALAAMSSLGYGQTWQDVKASRATGTTYYNTTGRPILVNVAKSQSGTGANMSASVNGVTVGFVTSDTTNGLSTGCISFIVPPSASYVVSASVGITYWAELR